MNAMRGAIVGVLLAALLATGAEGAGGMRLTSSADSLRADEQFTWSLPLDIVNTGTRGLYVDSLWMHVHGTGSAPTRLDFQALVRGMSAISVGDSGTLRLTVPASSPGGRIVLTLLAHDGDGARLRETLERPIAAGELVRYPSRHVGATGSTAEWIRVRATASAVPASGAPGLLLLADDTGNARDLLRGAMTIADQGIEVVSMSLPPQKASDDPVTKHAIGVVLDSLAATPGIDRTKLAVWGVSQSATAALIVATERSQLAAVVAQSARYDLPSVRSAATAATPRVLVLHGEADSLSRAADARDFVARRTARQLPVTETILPGQSHAIARGAAHRAAMAFLREALGLTRP